MKKLPALILITLLATTFITSSAFTATKKVKKKIIKRKAKIVVVAPAPTPKIIMDTTRAGEISKNETWGGKIFITGAISVPKGVTLTIEPGTTIAFKPSRDYKRPDKLGMNIFGTIKAVGTPDKQITFPSADRNPQNGDWSMIHLAGKTGSIFKYVIVEFGQQGINLWQSDAVISHSIIRWNNWEGLYAESYSTPLIEFNRVYQNGYNGMAMEQFNKAVVRNNLFEKNGTHGLHVDASEATVENNILKENGAAGLSLDDASTVTATNNSMLNNTINGIMCGEGNNKLTLINYKIVAKDNPLRCPDSVITKNEPGDGASEIAFDYPDTKVFDLGYTPGDRVKDKYQYVYPDDETRRIVKKIGTGLGLTWSLAMDGKNVWAATLSGDVYKLDGDTGKILKQFKVNSAQPWGMAFDGTNLWLTDFAEKRTYSVDPETGKELFSFPNPDQTRGAKGLTWDGQYLYIMGWTTSIVYKMDRQGKLMSQFKLKDIDGGGGLTWDGHYFWIPVDNRIGKFDKTGKLLGAIYIASEGTWDLAWENADNKYGGYLWASQRTNENWFDDEKIYKLEIVNDRIAK